MLDSIEDLSVTYCGGPSCSLLSLAHSALRLPRALPDWPHFHGRQVLPLHRARIGVAIACKLWGIGPGDDVLAPAYNCGSEIDPVFCAGATVRMYPIASNLRISLDDIKQRCTSRTRVVYVTHYFGWPHDLQAIAEFCRARGIYLFEDCALALFSKSESQWVGQAADAAIFSLPKTLGVPDGGVLTLRSVSSLDSVQLTSPRFAAVARRALSLTTSHLRYQLYLGASVRSARKPASVHQTDGEMPPSYYYEPSAAPSGMSRLTRNLIADIVPEQVAVRRRANYLQLAHAIGGLSGVRLLLGSAPLAGVCPVGLPVLIEQRDQWLGALWQRGIGAYPWWAGYHRGLDWSEFPDARRLKNGVLVLPVHQDLSPSHIDYIGQTIIELATATGRASVSLAHCT
jgi:perosamine synthetase